MGRQGQVEDLARTLGTSGLVTLVGVGGVGKSRLALRVATAACEQYAYGAWLVELATVSDAARVATRVATALGVREGAGSNPLSTLKRILRHRQLLLVLDNCEHVLPSCAELVSALLQDCENLTILATSREALGVPGEVVRMVAPLGVPRPDDSYEQVIASDAVQLLLARVQASDPTCALVPDSAPLASRICSLLDGLPLAIELAAARARTMSLSEIASRLNDPLALLTGGSRTGPPRHQTLRATIDWSYDLLAEPERRLLRRLAIFLGGFTVDSARAVCADDGVSSGELVDLIDRLVSQCFLTVDTQHEHARFGMLGTVRQYCLQRLEACGEAVLLRERHSEWCINVACSVPHEALHPTHVAHIEPEIENLRYALRWLIQTQQVSAATRLALGMSSFWLLRGSFAEARAALTALLDVAGPADIPHELPHAGTWAARMAMNQGDYADADDYLRRAVQLAHVTGNEYAKVLAYNQLGWLALLRGDPVRARAINATTLGQLAPNSPAAYLTRFQLALTDIELGDHARAREVLDELTRGMRPGILIGRSLEARALLAEQVGDHLEAERFLEASISSERAIGDAPGLIQSLTLRGIVAHARGARQLAANALVEALDTAVLYDSRMRFAALLEAMAGLAADAHPVLCVQLAVAADQFRQSLGAVALPTEQARIERYLEVARRRVGKQMYDDIWRDAQTLPLKVTLAKGRQLLCRLALQASPPEGTDGAHTLSVRELEVARLVGRGYSNRTIADELVITPKTVETHVSHLLNKLGLSNRIQVAAWAERHGVLESDASQFAHL